MYLKAHDGNKGLIMKGCLGGKAHFCTLKSKFWFTFVRVFEIWKYFLHMWTACNT